jgi:hypothetical protein
MLLAVLAWATACAEARAHFLFLRVGPAAEGGRRAEVFFGEQADAGDPKFVGKIAHTTLWAQAAPGAFRPLEVRPAGDRLVARVPHSGSVAVVGSCEYGVLARPGQTPFLLRYYPKALAGRPEELNRLERRPEIPFEIQATIDGDRVRLVALRDGRPVPSAAFHVVDLDLNEETIAAEPDGRATWTPKAPGRYAIYTRQDRRESGRVGDAPYEEIREFATLALDWPLIRTGADPEAVALFEQALAARAQWVDFPGFTARIAGSFEGRPFAGTATIAPDGSATVEADDAEARPWVEDQLASIAMHRQASAHDGPRPVLRFAEEEDDGHPLGRLLVVDGGHFASSYRIQDRQITVVNRALGRVNLTIRTLDHQLNAEGRSLPRSYLVQTWDAATGALTGVETVQDRWVRVGPFDLPAAHTVTLTSDSGFRLRSVELSGHRLGANAETGAAGEAIPAREE